MEWVEYVIRLRFHVEGFDPEKLSREYVEEQVKKKLSPRDLEKQGLIEIMVSEKGADGLLNVPLKNGSL